MPPAWQQWCRLCGKTDCNEAWTDVASVENLSYVIEKHFAISVSSRWQQLVQKRMTRTQTNPKEWRYALFSILSCFQFSESNDLHTNPLCAACFIFVLKLEEFAEQCDRTDWMFNRIIQSNQDQQVDCNYLQMVRYEAGLDEEKVSSYIWEASAALLTIILMLFCFYRNSASLLMMMDTLEII